ncbi:hypothetical protein C1645_837206 [Glomus cerebriforme]|uniref:Uncharacterized protein n=1 Tax=Glomus cerebriforme TaxID=658196 RepID=A0A397SBD8_9GLOM|nr:hypothetical protein C1645_837206 [Glomus cerebriforme]
MMRIHNLVESSVTLDEQMIFSRHKTITGVSAYQHQSIKRKQNNTSLLIPNKKAALEDSTNYANKLGFSKASDLIKQYDKSNIFDEKNSDDNKLKYQKLKIPKISIENYEEIISSTFSPNKLTVDISNPQQSNIENMDIDPIESTQNSNIITSLSHNTSNNIHTEDINETTPTSKNKEIANPTINQQILVPISQKHDYNHVSFTTNNDLQQQQLVQPLLLNADQNTGPSSISQDNIYRPPGPPSMYTETIPSFYQDNEVDSNNNAFHNDLDPSHNDSHTQQSKRWLNISGWTKIHRILITLHTSYKDLPILKWDHKILPSNFLTTKSQFKSFISTLKILRDKLQSDHEKSQIEFYVTRRITDLTDNQRRLINSLLNRKPKSIILDRIQYTNQDNDTLFTKDPNIIEQEAIKHFQTLGTNNHSTQKIFESINDIPNNWQNIYSPSSSIQDHWYRLLLVEIEEPEFYNVLKSCSNNKVAGKSTIHYEDIKQADPTLHCHIIFSIINYSNFNVTPQHGQMRYYFQYPSPKHSMEFSITHTPLSY